MQVIEPLFRRELAIPTEQGLVIPIIRPRSSWVIEGPSEASVKYDGLGCMVKDGVLYRRKTWDLMLGKNPPAPPEWVHWSHNPEQRSGHGWIQVTNNKQDAIYRTAKIPTNNGTYELCGPGIRGNPYKLAEARFTRHGCAVLQDVPVCVDAGSEERVADWFVALRGYLKANCIEGIVWRGSEGRYVKLKRIDFGIKWNVQPPAEPKPKAKPKKKSASKN